MWPDRRAGGLLARNSHHAEAWSYWQRQKRGAPRPPHGLLLPPPLRPELLGTRGQLDTRALRPQGGTALPALIASSSDGMWTTWQQTCLRVSSRSWGLGGWTEPCDGGWGREQGIEGSPGEKC